MARSYGHIMSAIWNDPEFRKLSCAAQRTYLMLITQADISSAGTLPLTVRRWAAYAIDSSSDSLSDSLSELAGYRFLVVDETTEEVLIRTFVKWDGGYTNVQKRQPAIRRDAAAVASPKIRASLAVELDELGVPHDLEDRLSGSLSDRLPDSPGVVSNATDAPQPTTHNPQPKGTANARRSITAGEPPTAQTIVTEWIDRCSARPPGRVVGQVAKLIGEMLGEGISPNHIRQGLKVWMSKDLAPSLLPSFVNGAMNGKNSSSVNGNMSTDQSDPAFQFGVG